MMRDRLLTLILAGGFVMLFLDTRFEHAGFTDVKPAAWIPIIASVVGVVASLAGLASTRWLRVTAGISFVLVTIVGLLGLYFHTGLQPKQMTVVVTTNRTALTSQAAIIAGKENMGEDLTPEEENAPDADAPPPVAPLSFCGLGMIGALLAFARPPKGS